MAIYCPYCGACIEEGSRFCTKCGKIAADPNIAGTGDSPADNKGESAGMKKLHCEMCGSSDLVKQNGLFVCQFCGCKYSVEEAKKLMIEGAVDVQVTVKVDNSDFVEKCLQNARRALNKEDWEEVEKYYNIVEQNAPNNMEAVFFSSYGKAMLSMTESDYYKRQQKFTVLVKSVSIISDYFEDTNEDKRQVLSMIGDHIARMYGVTYVYNPQASYNQVGSSNWCNNLLNGVRRAFAVELNQIAEKHNDAYIKYLISKNAGIKSSSGGCYVATCVYGSYDCPQVWTLRRFRDYTLAESWYGRAFIRTYYAISPAVVKLFGHTRWFKKLWKGKLDRMVKSLNANGVDNTPYEDRNW